MSSEVRYPYPGVWLRESRAISRGIIAHAVDKDFLVKAASNLAAPPLGDAYMTVVRQRYAAWNAVDAASADPFYAFGSLFEGLWEPTFQEERRDASSL